MTQCWWICSPSCVAAHLCWWWLPRRRPSRCGHPLVASQHSAAALCGVEGTQLSTQGAIGKHRLDVTVGLVWTKMTMTVWHAMLCILCIHCIISAWYDYQSKWLNKSSNVSDKNQMWRVIKNVKCRTSKRCHHQQFESLTCIDHVQSILAPLRHLSHAFWSSAEQPVQNDRTSCQSKSIELIQVPLQS